MQDAIRLAEKSLRQFMYAFSKLGSTHLRIAAVVGGQYVGPSGAVSVPRTMIPAGGPNTLYIGGVGTVRVGREHHFYGLGSAALARPDVEPVPVGFFLFGPRSDQNVVDSFRKLASRAGAVVLASDFDPGVISVDDPLIYWTLCVFRGLLGTDWIRKLELSPGEEAHFFHPLSASIQTWKQLLAHRASQEQQSTSGDSAKAIPAGTAEKTASPSRSERLQASRVESEFEAALVAVKEEDAQGKAALDQYLESMWPWPTPEQVAQSAAWQEKKQVLERLLHKRHVARLARFGWTRGQPIPASDPNFDKRDEVIDQAKMDHKTMLKVLGVADTAADEQSPSLERKSEEPGEEVALPTGEPPTETVADIPLDLTAYVRAKEIITKYGEMINGLTHKRLLKILDENPNIKWHKPSKQRLLVHLADFDSFAQRLQGEGDQFEQLDEYDDGVKARTAAVRQRKQQQGEIRPRQK